MNKFTQGGYRVVNHARRLYWQACKPETFGVKALVFHPQSSDLLLLIRQSYGNRDMYTVPGGGYKPKKETADVAARREVREEVGLELGPAMKLIDSTLTTSEGKRDHLDIYAAAAIQDTVEMSGEVIEAVWARKAEIQSMYNELPVSRFVLQALQNIGNCS